MTAFMYDLYEKNVFLFTLELEKWQKMFILGSFFSAMEIKN